MGTLVSFDGVTYQVNTDQGIESFKASDLKSVYSVADLSSSNPNPPSPSQSADSPTKSISSGSHGSVKSIDQAQEGSNPPPPSEVVPGQTGAVSKSVAAPAAPVIRNIPCHVRIQTKDGNSYLGQATQFDGTAYTIVTSHGTITVNAADLASVEYP